MKTTFSPLVIACPVMKNNKNISMIARSASCFGASKLIITGQNRIDPHISRDINLEELLKKKNLKDLFSKNKMPIKLWKFFICLKVRLMKKLKQYNIKIFKGFYNTGAKIGRPKKNDIIDKRAV